MTTPDAVTLSFTSVAGATGYEISSAGGGVLATLPGESQDIGRLRTFVVDGLSPETNYEFVVTTIGALENAPSDTLFVRTLPLAPEALGDLAFTVVDASTIDLNWPAQSFTGNFRIYQAIGDGPLQQIAVLPSEATSLRVEDIDPQTRYEFQLRTTNRAGGGSTAGLAGSFAGAIVIDELVFDAAGQQIQPQQFGGGHFPELETIRLRGDSSM